MSLVGQAVAGQVHHAAPGKPVAASSNSASDAMPELQKTSATQADSLPE